MPVRFAAAVRHLTATGSNVFVEAGGRNALSKLATRLAPGALVLSTLAQAGAGIALDDTLAQLRASGPAGGEEPARVNGAAPAPISNDEFEAFWRVHGDEVADLVRARLRTFYGNGSRPPSDAVPVQRPEAPVSDIAPNAGTPVPSAEALFAEIRAVYAEALEYPEEVFTGDVLLEAELGVDSVKQVELLTRVSRRFGLPPRDSGFRLAEYDTMDKLVELIRIELKNRNGAGLVVATA
jgi:acyl carrier protein